jgi:hypothetical protein
MTAAVAPARTSTPDPVLQQLLMRFTSALNRRRSYAASHPMVQSAESQLFESVSAMLLVKPVLTIGVARSELLIDGEPYVTKSTYARDLATRLHRRGVGAIAIQVGMPLLQLRETLGWLAHEPASGTPLSGDLPPVLSGISITRVAYDQLSLGEVSRSAEATGELLWHSLAQLAGDGQTDAHDSQSAASIDPDGVASRLRDALHSPDVARRTAITFMDLAAQAAAAPIEGRAQIGDQLHRALETLGESSFGPIMRSLGERALQQRFVSQVVDVLPVAAVATWIKVAAQAQDQQISHHMLRLMSKLSSFAEDGHRSTAESVFRGATQDLVKGWALDDPNPEEHVALLDRIALHELAQQPDTRSGDVTRSSVVESSRLVQMALELDIAGDDADAAADAIVASGGVLELLRWTDRRRDTATAHRMRQIAMSERAIRQLLLTEPVDRLQARELLDQLDAGSAEVLIDVLEAAAARGTRMIVRQRLSEFGAAIMPNLLARLDAAPWYLVRNILTLLHDIAEAQGGSAAGLDSMAKLLDHPQVQVRTEALRVLLLDAHAREAAIRHALHDDNERVVVLALQALTDSPDGPAELPERIVSELTAMVDAGRQNETVRARMVRALAHTKSNTVRAWLIGHVVKRSLILRRISLAEPTQTAVAALQVLQRAYATEPEVASVIALARRRGFDRRWISRDTGSSPEHAT